MSSCLQWAIFLLATSSFGWQLTQSDGVNLKKFLQPDDVGDYKEYPPSSDTTNCARECKKDGAPRLCYYRFTLEAYSTLTSACDNCTDQNAQCENVQCVRADGFEKGILTANRKLPGPSIQVCLGDEIVVDVDNKMPARSTTLHWHGIFQKGTQWNDGVPMVTQCAIPNDNKFRYNFYANQPGTFYWHSHDGTQKILGLQGSLVVRRPKEDSPNGKLYDLDLPDHVIFVNDWFHRSEEDQFPGMLNPNNYIFTYYLINGRGRYKDPTSGNTTTTPYTVFNVHKGNRYRFRIIAGTCNHCHTRVSFEGHNLTLIATDANPVKPVVVDSFDMFSGERYDFVLSAVNEVKSYWIKVQGMGPCAMDNIYQLAVLQYEGANTAIPRSSVPDFDVFNPGGIVLNPENATCAQGQNGLCVTQLESAVPINKKVLNPEPDIRFNLRMGYFYPEFIQNYYFLYNRPAPDTADTIFWFNNIANQMPASPPLSQWKDIPADAYCPFASNGSAVCNKELCSCFHVLKVGLGAVVEFTFLDESDAGGISHPVHLHGFAFNVMDIGRINDAEKVAAIVKSKKRPVAPVLKDTVAVPSAGYIVLRIVANNPGYWMFHCHFLFHHVAGMTFVLQVGEPEDLPPMPQGFPKCGDFLPPVGNAPQQLASSQSSSLIQWIDSAIEKGKKIVKKILRR